MTVEDKSIAPLFAALGVSIKTVTLLTTFCSALAGSTFLSPSLSLSFSLLAPASLMFADDTVIAFGVRAPW